MRVFEQTSSRSQRVEKRKGPPRSFKPSASCANQQIPSHATRLPGAGSAVGSG